MLINILGDLTANRDDRPLDLGGRRQRAVLAALVLARGETVSADRLVEAVWGDQPPPAAVAALQSYVSHLRRRLEPDRGARSRGSVIASRGSGYAIVLGDDAVDAWRFERLLRDPGADPVARLSEALALWRGPAYAEYAGEPWAEAEAARLNELREVARDQLAAARLARGEAAVLVPELETLVAAAPLREERWRLLVLALYRAHRQGEALAALRRARQVLADELGLDPGPALRALEAEVLAQSDALAVAAPVAAIPAAAPPPVTRAPDDLVDRELELRELRDAVTEALAGRARLVLIEGPAGIGKTRLLTEARRHASERGARVLAARGSRLEKEYGLGAIRQLFETAARDTPGALDGPAAAAASVFDLGGRPGGSNHSGLAAMHGVYWLAVHLSRASPIVLAMDDLQWCDSASLRFLAYLVRRVEGLPVLVIATLRTGEPYDDETVLAELAADPITAHLRPAPLTEPGVADLVRLRLGERADAAFVRACHRTTSGNPLLLRQLLRALESSGVRPTAAHAGTVTAIGSRAVSSMVLIRLRGMPPASTAVARAIAVLGDGAGLPTIAALAQVDEHTAAGAVAALARAEVVRHEYPIGFVHPLVRDAVYQDLPPGERQLQHERAARVLAGAAPEQIAAHLLQIPERGDPWVVEVLRTAADTALRRGAPDGAAAYLRRALAEPPEPHLRPAVLLALGQVETLGDGPAAIAHLREAYDDPATDPATFAEVARMLIHTLIFAGPEGDAPAFARHASARLAAEFVDERQAMTALERVAAYMYSGEPFVAGGFTGEISGDGLGARMLAVCRAWELLVRGEGREEAVRLARFALDGETLLDGDPGLFWVIAGVVLENSDVGAGTLWDDALAQGHTRGSLFTVLAAQLWSGWRDWQRGDLPEAVHRLVAANEQSLAWGGVPALGISYGEACLIRVLVDQGRPAEARAFVDEHLDRPRVGDGVRLVNQAHAYLLMAEGRPADALPLLTASVTGNPQWFEERSLRAQALAALGRTQEALEAAELDLAAMRRWGSRRAVGRALRLAGDIARDADRLREAVELLGGTEARLEYTRALFALGRVVDNPVDLLREALKLAEECGALGLRAEIAAALSARGEEVPAEPPVQLTTGERRMLSMAEGGADEREIAQALFLTLHTVRDTLAAIRRKQTGS